MPLHSTVLRFACPRWVTAITRQARVVASPSPHVAHHGKVQVTQIAVFCVADTCAVPFKRLGIFGDGNTCVFVDDNGVLSDSA